MARNNNLKSPTTTRSRFIVVILMLVSIAYARGAVNQHESSEKANESGPPAQVCSRDNKYVAINNRRANAGDYLWVIFIAKWSGN